MNRYIMVELVFSEEVNTSLHDMMLMSYAETSEELCTYMESLGAVMLISDRVNTVVSSRSFATVEHNFPLTPTQKKALTDIIAKYFVDAVIDEDGMSVVPMLYAVRFLETVGEVQCEQFFISIDDIM